MKIERLIATVMMLLERDVISANELAHHFNVNKRTIIRDMDTLNMANIPVYALRGVNGGYGLMDSYKFDKRLLSVSDLQNILAALAGLNGLMLSEDTNITLEKIKSLVPNTVATDQLKIYFRAKENRNELNNSTELLHSAIKNNIMVSINYIDRTGQESTREIEPYQLIFRETSWYVLAYSLNRADFRTFKLARILSLTLLNRHFKPRTKTPTPFEHSGGGMLPIVKIKIVIAKSMRDKLVERYGDNQLTEYDHDHYQTEITLPYHEFGYRYLTSFGTGLKILAPKNFIKDYQKYLHRLIEINN